MQQFQIIQGRAAPRINRLVIVTHGGEHRARAREKFEQLVLHGVGVLILIDQDVTDFILPTLTHLGIFAQQLHGQANQIIKIHRLIRRNGCVVTAVHARKLQFVLVFCQSQCLLRADFLIFPQRNLTLHGANQAFVGGRRQLLNDAKTIVRIEYRKFFFQTQMLALSA